MKILDGKKIQEKRAKTLSSKIKKLKKKPTLAIVQVGNNSASNIYINQKVKFGESIGANVEVFKLKETATEKYLEKLIGNLNEDKEINGIIVQLPLPKKLNVHNVIDFISPEKDVDGLTSVNTKKLNSNQKGIVPATAKGIKTILDEYKINVASKHVVVVGRSLLVGRSTANLFLNYDATVTICHSKTKNLAKITQSADILIVATGQKALISSKHLNKGQIVIDVGISVVDGELYGDVNKKALESKNATYTPVPGGVGPMTVLSLFENLLDSN